MRLLHLAAPVTPQDFKLLERHMASCLSHLKLEIHRGIFGQNRPRTSLLLNSSARIPHFGPISVIVIESCVIFVIYFILQ